MSRSILALVTVLVGAAAETYPLFSWSGSKDLFANYEPASASELIAAKHKGFKASVVYLHSMSTEQLAGGGNTDAMQNAIGKSDSSIFRPLATSSINPEELVAPYNGHVVKASEAVTFLKNNPDVFSSAQPKVVLVDLRDMEATKELLAQADEIRSSVEAAFEAGTQGYFCSAPPSTPAVSSACALAPASNHAMHFPSPVSVTLVIDDWFCWFAQTRRGLIFVFGTGNFLSVLTSTKAGPGRKLLWQDTHNIAEASTDDPKWAFYPRPTGGVYYITPSGLLGLGATMYMFFIAICGYCCLFALQTPDLFEGDQKKEMDRALGQEGGK
jgi:hypothetical protein